MNQQHGPHGAPHKRAPFGVNGQSALSDTMYVASGTENKKGGEEQGSTGTRTWIHEESNQGKQAPGGKDLMISHSCYVHPCCH